MRSRKRRCWAAIVLLTWQVPNSSAATNCLSGSLAVDTFLAATNNPHRICGDLTVGGGVTLTIEAGAIVQLDPRVNLTVASGGRILAEGTETHHIAFTAGPGASAWGGITLRGQGDSPETRLTYVDFAGNGSTCLQVTGGTLALDHATFGTTSHQYLSLDASSFVVSHCYFPSSSAPFELVHGTKGIKNGGRGIIRDCFFGASSGYNDIMDFTGGNRPGQPIIQYYRNVFSGATDDILDLDGTDAWIEGNIFLHAHRNGNTPDTSAAISGGDSGDNTSEITIIGNLFYDCDQAAMAKEGNFYALINNTILRTTKTGGIDGASGVVAVRDLEPSPTAFGAGFYLEANIIADAEQLVRNYDPQQTSVTFVHNLLPAAWDGPGASNVVADPMLKHVPELAETYFTNWTEAQVLWDWFSLLPGSPARAAGPNGRDLGGVIPLGVSISGEPDSHTDSTTARLTVGINRTGSGIPASGWPQGAGFISYQWRLDAGAWSAEFPLNAPIVLTNLAPGPHQVAVVGKNDAGLFQNDPVLGTNAVVTLSRTWSVQNTLAFTGVARSGPEVTLRFRAEAGQAYSVEYKDALAAPGWSKLDDVSAQLQAGEVEVIDHDVSGASRFYRVVAPAR